MPISMFTRTDSRFISLSRENPLIPREVTLDLDLDPKSNVLLAYEFLL